MSTRCGYKVVRRITDDRYDGEILVSALQAFGKEYRVDRGLVYVPGKPTRPKPGYGPMCVFGGRLEALEFARIYGDHKTQVLACKYVPSKEGAVWDGLGFYRLRSLPKGTILADEVTIKEGN